MSQAAVLMKQGITLFKQMAAQISHGYAQVTHTMKTNVVLRPVYRWWEQRFWLKEESCFVNRGRARLFTYLALFLLIRSQSAKKAAETEILKKESKEQIVATALRLSGK
ncbi:unnamed protein product [Thelazia callipaeda]|uniref:Transposase n=1 Tax=Thelazia callipaeda TaxID=103827 RepID=A0A0N5D433_THECL|nr:unnamed protein product [Thelazia callipaeda]